MFKYSSLPIIFLTLAFNSQLPSAENRTRELMMLSGDAFKLYSSGEYQKVYPLLRRILQEDSSASDWMNYFLLADIYLRWGMKDSVNWVLSLGESRTAKSRDQRLVKRNQEVWSNLRDQLKNQRDFFTVPAFRKLEDFEEKPKSDTLLTKAGVIPVDTTKKLVPRDSPIVSSTPDPNRISAPEIPYSFMPGFDEHRPSRTGYPQPTLVGGNQALQEYIQTQGLFPDSARQANINRGFVMVEVIVDTSGNAIDFKIIEVQPENMGFEELALQAMRAMKYEPAVLEGVKVEGILQQPVMFIRLEE